MSRRLRSNIPTIKENLKPIHHDTDKVRAELQLGHDKSRSYHDRSAHVLKPLNSGDSVRVQLHDKKWSPATVLKPLGNRSYTVKTPTGCMYRRNRKFIHKTNEVPKPENLELPQYNIVESRSIEQSPDVMLDLSSNNVQPSESPKISSPQIPKTLNPYVTRSGRIVKPKVIPSM
jgi:predicted ribonuclease toxin of YeeF-YezG toxin-antitoxin module